MRRKKSIWSKPRRTSGNGTNARQWLYLFWNIPCIWMCKIGIGGNYQRRSKEVSRTVFGVAVPVFAVKILFAYKIEKALHRTFRVFNIPFHGSGKEEWFFILVLPFAAVVMLFFFLLEWVIILGILLFISWIAAGSPKIW